MTSVIITICTLSTFLTALSLSVMATNGIIRGGGPYYVISRTLGPSIGGSIGLLFYLGNTLSTSMFVLGAVETFHSTPVSYLVSFYPSIGSKTMSVFLVFSMSTMVSVGFKYISAASSIFLTLVLLSILSIVIGAILFSLGVWNGTLTETDRIFMENLYPNYTADMV